MNWFVPGCHVVIYPIKKEGGQASLQGGSSQFNLYRQKCLLGYLETINEP
jgi:hypothetical protein